MPAGILFTADERMFSWVSRRCWSIVQVYFPYVHLTQFIDAVRYTKTGASGFWSGGNIRQMLSGDRRESSLVRR